MKNDTWYCPAVDREIESGLCREYCLAGKGGPADALPDLEQWVRLSRRYKDVAGFHRVCAGCAHCRWEKR